MKIRTDYVSNSSSSSFVICGKILGFDKIPQRIIDKVSKEYSEDAEDDDFDTYEVIEELRKKGIDAEMENSGWNEEGDVCVGLDPSKMNNTETLKEFKERIAKKLKAAGFNDDDVKPNDFRFISGGSESDGTTFFESLG